MIEGATVAVTTPKTAQEIGLVNDWTSYWMYFWKSFHSKNIPATVDSRTNHQIVNTMMYILNSLCLKPPRRRHTSIACPVCTAIPSSVVNRRDELGSNLALNSIATWPVMQTSVQICNYIFTLSKGVRTAIRKSK